MVNDANSDQLYTGDFLGRDAPGARWLALPQTPGVRPRRRKRGRNPRLRTHIARRGSPHGIRSCLFFFLLRSSALEHDGPGAVKWWPRFFETTTAKTNTDSHDRSPLKPSLTVPNTPGPVPLPERPDASLGRQSNVEQMRDLPLARPRQRTTSFFLH